MSFLDGCSKKPLNTSQVHAVTQELLVAARGVTGPNTEITVRPEVSTGGKPGTMRDNIRIGLHDRERLGNLEQALHAVAKRHNLTAGAVSSAQGNNEFLLSRDLQITHTIQIVIEPREEAEATNTGKVQRVVGPGPKLAIIVDDLGRDLVVAEKIMKLPYPLTISVIPNLADSAKVAEAAYKRGDEVLLHLPMQAEEVKPTLAEPVELKVGMPPNQVESILDANLKTVPHAAGVNNHQGSRATADTQLMDALMASLRQRGLFFIDSRTSVETVAYEAAEKEGVRAAFRNAQFLDDVPSVSAISAQLKRAEADAVKKGWAITIGHPHPATIEVLSENLPRMRSAGIQLVFASDVVK